MILRLLGVIACVSAIGAALGLFYFKFARPVYEGRALAVVSPTGPEALRAAGNIFRSPDLAQAVSVTGGKVDLDRIHTGPAGQDLIEVRVSAPTQAAAKDLTESWVNAYQAHVQRANHDFLQSQLGARTKAANDAKAKLDDIEHNIAALKRKTGINDVSVAITNAITYRGNLLQQRDQDQAALETTKRQAEQEKHQLATLPKTTQDVVETVDPVLQGLQAHLADLEKERVRLLGQWLPTSKPVLDVDQEIKQTVDQIGKSNHKMTVEHSTTGVNPQRRALEDSYFKHKAEIAGFAGSIAEVNKALSNLDQTTAKYPGTQLEMDRLTREKSHAEEAYVAARNDLDSLKSGKNLAFPTVSPIGPAEAAAEPIYPKLPTCLGYGAAAGALLGLLLGLAIRSPREIASVSTVSPELAQVTAPALPMKRGEGLAALALPSTNPAEAYRFMVFSLQSQNEGPKTILFTGVSNDSLSAEAAGQFAVALAQTGVRTLLVDCNLRDPSLTKAFGFLGKSGITDILSRTMLPTAGTDLVLETQHPELYFLPAGTLESEGIGGFQNLQVQGLLAEVNDKAEIKVVNLPACGMVSDASRLARHADKVCLVAGSADHNRGLVGKAENILKLAGARDIGVILVDDKLSRRSFIA